MKEKLEISSISILGIAATTIGFYLLQKGPLFAILFFIGAIICGIMVFNQYSYLKNKNALVDAKSLPSETIIKYSTSETIITLLGYSIFIIIGIFLLSMVPGFDFTKYKKTDFSLLVLASFFIISYGYKTFKLFKKLSSSDVLNISNNVIILDSIVKMDWNDIQNEKIIVKKEYSSNSKYKVDTKYLSLFHQNKKIEKKIEGLDVADYTLEQYLKIYRNRYQQNNGRSAPSISEEENVFQNIMPLSELLSLDQKETDRKVEHINLLAEKNPESLLKYCQQVVDFEETNVRTIYFALSEKSHHWESFLYEEFTRLFELAKTSNISNDIFDVLEEISDDGDEENDQLSEKVLDYLYNQLENSNDNIRGKAIWFISLWMFNDGDLQKNNPIVQRVHKLLKDDHWKVRWIANKTLSSFDIFSEEEIKIPFKDKLRGRLGNPYEIN